MRSAEVSTMRNFNSLCRSSNIDRVIKDGCLKWEGHVDILGEGKSSLL